MSYAAAEVAMQPPPPPPLAGEFLDCGCLFEAPVAWTAQEACEEESPGF